MEPITLLFEEMMPDFQLTGEAIIREGPLPAPPEPDPDPTQSTRTIRCGQDWWVHLVWTASGWMNNAIDGNWYLQVFLEKMGIGEFQLMEEPITEPFVSEDPHTYHRDIPFVGQSVAVPPGLYKIAVSLTMKGSEGVPLPITAVAEGPILQFYEVGT